MQELLQTTKGAEDKREVENHGSVARIAKETPIEDVEDDPDICHPAYFHPFCVMSGVVDSCHIHKEMRVAIHIPFGTSKKGLSVKVGPTQNILDI